jgi:hypothetical protein
MNILDVIKEIQDDPTKKFSCGWNTIESGNDSYEIIISDKSGHKVEVLLSSYSEIKSK